MRAEDSSLAPLIVEQIADAVVGADTGGTIVVWNAAAAKLFGYSAAEALGQSLDLIIPEHLRGSHWRGFTAAMASGVMRLEGRPTLTRAQHQSGRKLYVDMTFAVVKDAEGAARAAVAAARDVTERVDADPLVCDCLYVGTQQAYHQYKANQLAQHIADEQLMAAQTYSDAAWSWPAWGPWDPTPVVGFAYGPVGW